MGILDRAYETDAIALSYGNGETDVVGLVAGSADPSQSPGVAAPISTIYFRDTGEIFFKENSADTEWKKLLADDGSTTMEKVVFREEFLPSGASPYFNTGQWNSGTSGAGSSVLGVVSQGGQVEIKAGAADGRYGELYWTHEVFKKEEEVIFQFRGKLSHTTSQIIKLGLWEPGSDHSAYFLINNGDTKWQCFTKDGSGSTTVDSGITLTTNPTNFKIITETDKITFLIDDETVSEQEDNLPTNRLKADFYVEAKSASARSFFLDAIKAVAMRET